MSREIKFRVWYCGQFVHPVQLGLFSAPYEQFTGIKDRKGREIYEGDILRVGKFWEGDEDEPDLWMEDSVQKVVWGGNEYPAFHMSPGLDDECNDFSSVLLRDEKIDMEIIGNIHENPELLK